MPMFVEVELLPNPEFGCGMRKAEVGGCDILVRQVGGRWFVMVVHGNHRHIIPEDSARALLQVIVQGPIGGKRSSFSTGRER